MKITGIEVHILVAPDLKADATSSSQDDAVVVVKTDEGIHGIGEADTSPWLVKAAIEAPSSHSMAMSIRESLIGQDPFDTGSLWNKIYTNTAMTGRRGAVLSAMGAIDMALWDIKGKALGLPVYKLLGGACQEFLTPYASLQPAGDTVAKYRDSLVAWAKRAVKMGYKAAKMECTLAGPYKHLGLSGSDEEMTEIVAAVREAVGPDFTLMVDVQYLWRDAKTCLRTVSKWADYDIFFLETPLLSDNGEGYAYLRKASPIRIAAGEWLQGRQEFIELFAKECVDVAQPDVGRVGGLTEAMRVCHMAEDHGLLVVPHCWKTGISISASAHMAAALPHCPFIEFLPREMCDSALRRELTVDELKLVDGRIELPKKPGLGVELNPEALRKFTVRS